MTRRTGTTAASGMTAIRSRSTPRVISTRRRETGRLTRNSMPEVFRAGVTTEIPFSSCRSIPDTKGRNGEGIRVVDYFTPHNQAKLDKYDEDLASSGVLLLPDGLGGRKHPNLLLASGKLGTLYVINRNKMGHFTSLSDELVAGDAASHYLILRYASLPEYRVLRGGRRRPSVLRFHERHLGLTRRINEHVRAPRRKSRRFVRWRAKWHRLGHLQLA